MNSKMLKKIGLVVVSILIFSSMVNIAYAAAPKHTYRYFANGTVSYHDVYYTGDDGTPLYRDYVWYLTTGVKDSDAHREYYASGKSKYYIQKWYNATGMLKKTEESFYNTSGIVIKKEMITYLGFANGSTPDHIIYLYNDLGVVTRTEQTWRRTDGSVLADSVREHNAQGKSAHYIQNWYDTAHNLTKTDESTYNAASIVVKREITTLRNGSTADHIMYLYNNLGVVTRTEQTWRRTDGSVLSDSVREHNAQGKSAHYIQNWYDAAQNLIKTDESTYNDAGIAIKRDVTTYQYYFGDAYPLDQIIYYYNDSGAATKTEHYWYNTKTGMLSGDSVREYNAVGKSIYFKQNSYDAEGLVITWSAEEWSYQADNAMLRSYKKSTYNVLYTTYPILIDQPTKTDETTYDAYGKFLNRTVRAWTYDTDNQLIKLVETEYSAAGSVLSKRSQEYHYNSLGRISSVDYYNGAILSKTEFYNYAGAITGYTSYNPVDYTVPERIDNAIPNKIIYFAADGTVIKTAIVDTEGVVLSVTVYDIAREDEMPAYSALYTLVADNKYKAMLRANYIMARTNGTGTGAFIVYTNISEISDLLDQFTYAHFDGTSDEVQRATAILYAMPKDEISNVVNILLADHAFTDNLKVYFEWHIWGRPNGEEKNKIFNAISDVCMERIARLSGMDYNDLRIYMGDQTQSQTLSFMLEYLQRAAAGGGGNWDNDKFGDYSQAVWDKVANFVLNLAGTNSNLFLLNREDVRGLVNGLANSPYTRETFSLDFYNRISAGFMSSIREILNRNPEDPLTVLDQYGQSSVIHGMLTMMPASLKDLPAGPEKDALIESAYQFYVNLINSHPEIFKQDVTFDIMAVPQNVYLIKLKAQVQMNLVDLYDNITPQKREEIASALGLSGIRREIWMNHEVIINDNNVADNAQLQSILNILNNIPKGVFPLGKLRHIKIGGAIHSYIMEQRGFSYDFKSTRGGVNIFGDRVGIGVDAMPRDGVSESMDYFTMVVVHELNHNVASKDTVTFWNKILTLVQRAGTDENQYIVGPHDWVNFPDDFYVANPQEFLAYQSDAYFMDTQAVLNFAIRKFDEGYHEPINQLLFLMDLYSRDDAGDPTNNSVFFRVDSNATLQNWGVSLQRDSQGNITGLTDPTGKRFEFTDTNQDGFVDMYRTISPDVLTEQKLQTEQYIDPDASGKIAVQQQITQNKEQVPEGVTVVPQEPVTQNTLKDQNQAASNAL